MIVWTDLYLIGMLLTFLLLKDRDNPLIIPIACLVWPYFWILFCIFYILYSKWGILYK